MPWGQDHYDKAREQQELQKEVMKIIGLLQAAMDYPDYDGARPFLEQACEELQEILYADQQKQEIEDLKHRAGVGKEGSFL